MNVWLRLSATFHEHPKMLAVRSAAGSRADSAELGWYRILMAAKRYGRWSFASESHLEHIAGPFYRFVALYRDHGLLDDLTVHDGESYNAIKTPAERKEEQRERDKVSRKGVTQQRDMARDQSVTLEERDRETEEREERDASAGYPTSEDRDSLDTYHELTGYRPWGQWSGKALQAAIRDYTDEWVEAALRAEVDADADRGTLLNRTLARLAKAADKQRQAAAKKPRAIRTKTDEAERQRVLRELMETA